MSRRMLLIIVLPFWAYVTASNVLYAHTFGGGLASVMTGTQVFAAPLQRVLQHLLLLPVLVACYHRSLRLGWSPWWRSGVLQALLALGFALITYPLLGVAEYLLDPQMWRKHDGALMPDAGGIMLWVASTLSFLLTYGFGLALVNGFAFYRRSRDSELRIAVLERTVIATRLAALRMQLSPHTLFNLLHTIHGQIGFGPRAAQVMVVQLAELLRRLLAAGERDFTPLAEELQLVQAYLELHQLRFVDRLGIRLPEAGAVPAVWVPSLILYPLAENAIVHGLAGHEGVVQVSIEVTGNADTLTLCVRNSVAPGRAHDPEGLGLRNLRERLAVQFDAQASLSAGPEGACEWLAEIRMPWCTRGGAGA